MVRLGEFQVDFALMHFSQLPDKNKEPKFDGLHARQRDFSIGARSLRVLKGQGKKESLLSCLLCRVGIVLGEVVGHYFRWMLLLKFWRVIFVGMQNDGDECGEFQTRLVGLLLDQSDKYKFREFQVSKTRRAIHRAGVACVTLRSLKGPNWRLARCLDCMSAGFARLR